MSWVQHEEDQTFGQFGQASTRKFFQVLWQHKFLVILGGVIGLILGGIYYVRCSPVYESKTQILVIRKNTNPLPMSGSDHRMVIVQDYLASHIILLRSPFIVKRAVERSKLANLESFTKSGDPAGAILMNLQVDRDETEVTEQSNNNVINMAYRGPVAEECPIVLNAIIESYEGFLDETFRNVSSQTLSLIQDIRGKYEAEYKLAKSLHTDFLLKNEALYRSNGGTLLKLEQVADLEKKRLEHKKKKEEVQIQLDNILKAREENKGIIELLGMVPESFKEKEKEVPLRLRLEKDLVPLLIEEKKLLEKWGKNHPDVIQIRIAKETTLDYFNKLAKSQKGEENSLSEIESQDASEELEQYLDAMRDRITYHDNLRQAYEKVLAEEQLKAKALTKLAIEEESLRADKLTKQEILKSFVQKLRDINLGHNNQDGFDAKTLAQPDIGSMVAPKMAQILLAGLVLGLFAGVGLAYLAELTDKGFRTPEEIRRRLGLPIIGHIPVLTPNQEALEKSKAGLATIDPYLISYHSPKSVDAEAYRAVRTALYFSTQGEGHNLVQVTSPNMGDGKSTLSTNLSVSIAQSGKKTILIDADLRRPRLHKIFSLPNKVGLSSLITDQCEPGEAIQQTAIPNLSILSCGPLPPNPAELLTSPHFPEVLELLRSQYEYVIVDTPPLLVVTDPSVVAPRVDGVILTLRLTKKAGPLAERAREVLSTLGVKVIGVVVNGLSRQRSGGQYGGSYYSNYGYESSYEYESDDEESYYHDQEENLNPDETSPSSLTSNALMPVDKKEENPLI